MIVDVIKQLEMEADELEQCIKKQSDIYLQIEDRGITMVRIREIRRIIKILKKNNIKEK